MNDPVLILPIETKVRELYSKTYLAYEAACAGMDVVVGEARAIRDRIHTFPTGSLFLDKAVAPNRERMFEAYKKFGIQITAWCEEGLAILDPAAYLRHRICPEALEQTEAFFVWGPCQERLITGRYPHLAGRVKQTGNPRVDFLCDPMNRVFKDKAALYKKTYPKMILINTNFAVCNHKLGPDAFLELWRKGGKISTPEEEAFARGWQRHKSKLLAAFLELIPELGRKFPLHQVVVRPHPSENHDFYRERFREIENIYVEHQDSAVPWLMACDVLIHNGCTTGIEATVMKKNVLAFQPVTSEKYDIKFPNDVSVPVRTTQEVIEHIQAVEEGRFVRNTAEDILPNHLYGLDGNAVSSIVSELLSQKQHPQSPSWAQRTVIQVRRMISSFALSRKGSEPKNKTEYAAQKFDSLTLQEMKDLIDLYSHLKGKDQHPDVTEVWENGFRLKGLG